MRPASAGDPASLLTPSPREGAPAPIHPPRAYHRGEAPPPRPVSTHPPSYASNALRPHRRLHHGAGRRCGDREAAPAPIGSRSGGSTSAPRRPAAPALEGETRTSPDHAEDTPPNAAEAAVSDSVDRRGHRALRVTLEEQLTGPFGHAVESRRPVKPPVGPRRPTVQVQHLLYQVHAHAALRNADLPTRDVRRPGARPKRARPHYLLTFHGTEDAHTRNCSSAYHTHPGTRIRSSPDRARQAFTKTGSNLREAPERVKFTPVPLSTRELSKLWSVFFGASTPLPRLPGFGVILEGEERRRPRSGARASRQSCRRSARSSTRSRRACPPAPLAKPARAPRRHARIPRTEPARRRDPHPFGEHLVAPRRSSTTSSHSSSTPRCRQRRCAPASAPCRSSTTSNSAPLRTCTAASSRMARRSCSLRG